MKTYKDFPIISVGESDIANLTLVGCHLERGMTADLLSFGGDGCYRAYHVTEKDVEIGSHYFLKLEYDYWLKIYDDHGLVFQSTYGNHVDVYRAGDYGFIIQEYKK